MKLAKAGEMKEIDRKAISDFSIPGIILMEHAAAAVCAEIKRAFPSKVKTCVISGRGNNGGDGWAVARLLFQAGWDVTVFHPGRQAPLPPDAGQNREIALHLGVKEEDWSELLAVSTRINGFALIVDALLGTGFRGRAEGDYEQLIDLMNSTTKPVVAVDLPSGLEADTGRAAGPVVKAWKTVTFGLPKVGLGIYPGRSLAGEIIVDSIGLPRELLNSDRLKHFTYLPKEAANLIPRRGPEAHKGSCGRLLIIGGSPGLTGAPLLAGMAALRSGAGLVTLGLRDGLSLCEKPMELMVKTWSQLQRELKESSVKAGDVVIIGPGLSQAPDGRDLLLDVLALEDLVKVVDADALNILATQADWWARAKGPLVLTPHPGEMARLTGLSVDEVQKNRLELVREQARLWQATLVLKGPGTLVGAPDGLIYVNLTGNPGMATGGMGDILSGVIGALLGQGLPALEGACLGVYLHGAAADLAAGEVGEHGMIAGDLLSRLPRVFGKGSGNRSARRVFPTAPARIETSPTGNKEVNRNSIF